MVTFVLIHGAWHGAWCWERLAPALEEHGHAVHTADLPIGDGSATLEDYAAAVLEAIPASTTGPLVVVGHSLGAMVVPLVAARRPVDHMVMLCGVVPWFDGLPWEEGPPMAVPGATSDLRYLDDGASVWPTVESATTAFYEDCGPADARWAFSRLRGQNSNSLWTRPYPLDTWPPGRLVSIAATEDRMVTIEFARHAARARMGIDLVEIPGHHSPFLARPAELAGTLTAAIGE